MTKVFLILTIIGASFGSWLVFISLYQHPDYAASMSIAGIACAVIPYILAKAITELTGKQK